jgi:hypothetical protein
MTFHTYLSSEAVLEKRINAYFDFIEGEYHMEPKPGKEVKEQPAGTQKVWNREPQPATLADLATFLGFNSLTAFDDYLETGKYADMLKWGHRRIEALYERKLPAPSAAGAIFALKRMGWNEREEAKPENNAAATVMAVEIHESGPKTAGSEKEVVL